MRVELRLIVVSFLIAVAVILAGPAIFRANYILFGNDYTVRLPQGNYLVNVNTEPVILTGPASGDIYEIGPSVDGYLVFPRIIVGHVSGKSDSGYFVLDMVTGKIDQGLSKAAWMKILQKYEITEEPKLQRPNRWDEFRGKNRPQVPWE